MSQLTTMTYRSRDPRSFGGLAARLRQFTALLRKELRENLWFAVAFVAILSIPPLQYALSTARYNTPSDGFGIIIILLAAFAGILSGLRDLADSRQDFWRSRPITARAFALTRLAAGLLTWLLPATLVFAAYAVACVIRFVPEIPQHPMNYHISNLLTYTLPQVSFALAAFTIAHLAATLLRSAVDAALLALAALLCLWLLPVVLPPLSFLSTLSMMKHLPLYIYPWSGSFGWSEGDAMLRLGWLGIRVVYRPDFALHLLGMLCIAGTSSALACLAVCRNWHLPVNRKFTLWSLGGSAVLLLASAGLQIRSTLSSAQELSLLAPVSRRPCTITHFLQTDRQLLAIAYDPKDRDPAAPDKDHFPYYAFPLLQGSPWTIGDPISLGRAASTNIFSTETRPQFWTPALPDRIYTFDRLATSTRNDDNTWRTSIDRLTLRETSLAPQTAGQVLREVELLPLVGPHGATLVGVYNTTVLFRPSYESVIPCDLSSPTLTSPGAIKANDVNVCLEVEGFDKGRTSNGGQREPYTFALPGIPSLSPAQRLDMVVASSTRLSVSATLSPGRVALLGRDWIRTYRQTDLTPSLARFAPAAKYEPSTIESLMYGNIGCTAQGISGDWLYRLYWSGGLRLFRLGDSSITLAGQFNRPADRLLAAHLAANHLLVGGQKLYIVPLPQ